MNNEPVAWMNKDDSSLSFKNHGGGWQPLYTHPAKTEEFMAGDAICPSCGCKSLYKTARSEWCVTHKCLWQKDYELTLTDEEINQVAIDMGMFGDLSHDEIELCRNVLIKAQEK